MNFKTFLQNPIVEFVIFCAIFISIGCLANVFNWMYWPSIGFYGLVFISVIFGVIVALYNGIKAIINKKA